MSRFETICFMLWLSGLTQSELLSNYTEFPEDFLFGVGSSSYQTEGAWNVNGKGLNIWDVASHAKDKMVDGSTGDMACDSYHKYKEDIRLLAKLKVNFYRFSISWTRLFPNGTINYLNNDGVNYYNNLINGLLQSGIEPMIILFHWDTPQYLQDLGGWANRAMITWFGEYADVVFRLFGDRVKVWTTINQPYVYCTGGYGNILAPFINSSGYGQYLCIHNMIKAHAKAYHVYRLKYKEAQKGVVGISLYSLWFMPADPASESDQLAAQTSLEFQIGTFLWPIFKTGDYPASLRERINDLSLKQGFKQSRLPSFTEAEKLDIFGSADFLGLNHYASFLTQFDNQTISQTPTSINDMNMVLTIDPNWGNTTDPLFTTRPQSLYELLLWIDMELGRDLNIMITENGYNGSPEDKLDDEKSIAYMHSYLQAVLDAKNQGVNVIGYTWWSLLDNFQWTNGYTGKFGLYHVDFGSANRTRTAKKVAMAYHDIIVTRKIDPSYMAQNTDVASRASGLCNGKASFSNKLLVIWVFQYMMLISGFLLSLGINEISYSCTFH